MLRPPTLTVPDRSAPSFGLTLTLTVPFPGTGDGLAVIQLRSSLTGYSQFDSSFTPTVSSPAALENSSDVGATPGAGAHAGDGVRRRVAE